MLRHLALCLALASPAAADVAEAVKNEILPGYAGFRTATESLSAASDKGCDPALLRPAFDAAFDAWMDVAHLHLGPAEDEGRALAIAFWPDPKGAGAKATAGLLAAEDAQAIAPAAFARASVAARGLFALERLLYGAAPEGYACALIKATAGDLARMAAEIDAGWTGGFAAALTDAGQAGDTVYLSPPEARQAIYTQLVAGLEFIADERLGRPLGTFDRPRPERAEARASGRSLRDVRLSLAALRRLAVALLPASPLSQAAFDKATGLAAKLDDPVFAGVADPQGWLKVQILQQAVFATRDAVTAEIGHALQVGVGFNAGDGD